MEIFGTIGIIAQVSLAGKTDLRFPDLSQTTIVISALETLNGLW